MINNLKKLDNKLIKKSKIFAFLIVICLFIIFLYSQIEIKFLYENQSAYINYLKASNNAEITNNANTQNSSSGTNINSVGESTITRVEEKEKLVSRDYWDWWTPINFEITETAGNLTVEKPNLEINKSVISKTGCENLAFAGEELTYEITIKNNGTKIEENIEIADTIPQNTTFLSVNSENNIEAPEQILDLNNTTIGLKWTLTIEPGQTLKISFTVKVNDDAKGTISNTAKINGEKTNETHTAIIKSSKSSVIMRNGKEVKIAKEGDQIIYTITANNTGDIAGDILIQDIVPEETKLVKAEGAEISEDKKSISWKNVNVPALQDGGTTSIQFTVEIVDINKEIKNKANVGGNDTEQNIIPTADINIAKDVVDITRNGVSVGKDAKVEVGDVIEYSITVTNTGSVELTNIEIQEKLEGVNIEGDLTKEKLAPGEQYIVKVTYTVTSEKDVFGNAEKIIYNKAIVSGDVPTDLENPEETEKVINEDDETTIVEDIPGLYVIKEADKTENVKVGETINYTIKVTNTGNVTLENVPVIDTITTAEGKINLKVYKDKNCTQEVESVEKIEVGETAILYTKYTVTQTDIDSQKSISNIAIATIPGTEPEEDITITSEPEETKPEGRNPKLNVVKEADKTENVKVGETINYTIKVTNTGNVTLENVPVVDTITTSAGNMNLKIYQDKDCLLETDKIVKIKVGETVTLYTKYTVTQKDIDEQISISNIAKSTIPENGEQTTSEPEETVPEEKKPGLNIEKTATGIKKKGEETYSATIDKVRPGDVIEYTITVDNIGNTTLNNITVTDSLKVTVDGEEKEVNKETGVSTIAIIDSLAPDDELVLIKAYYTVTEADSASLDKIHNESSAISESGTTGKGIDETVPVNRDTTTTINIIWDDNQNQDGKRPQTVTINLYADGEFVKTETISGTNYTFEKLPTYNENGEKIVYTVTENAVNEYTTTYSGDTLTITNKHIPELTSVTIKKEWDDN